jgi:hypothetical protein
VKTRAAPVGERAEYPERRPGGQRAISANLSAEQEERLRGAFANED